jgi:hypothetical protein
VVKEILAIPTLAVPTLAVPLGIIHKPTLHHIVKKEKRTTIKGSAFF